MPEYSYNDNIHYGNVVSDVYFTQDYDMYHNNDELFGGFRGLCWRARHGQELYGLDNVATSNDEKFMFYMTSLIESNTSTTNYKLYNIFREIHNLTDPAEDGDRTDSLTPL